MMDRPNVSGLIMRCPVKNGVDPVSTNIGCDQSRIKIVVIELVVLPSGSKKTLEKIMGRP